MSDTLEDDDVGTQQDQDEASDYSGASYQPVALRQTGPGVYSPAPAPQRQAIPTVGTPAQGGRHAIGSRFTPDEGDESYGYNAPPPKPDESEDQTSWSDYAKNTWNAVRDTAAQFAGLGEYISREITGDSTLSKQIGAIRDGLNSDIQNSISSMTP